MTDPTVPDPSTSQEAASSGPGRRSASTLGLSIVSALNVLSLAFLAYHFAGHPDQPASLPAKPSSSGKTMLAAGEMPNRPHGNIDLAPISGHILSVVSGIAGTDPEAQHHAGPPAVKLARLTLSSPPALAADDQRPNTWVQLGALSKETAARGYWSRLQQRYADLLKEREPHYFGPSDVGGSLHHIRLGPMTANAASDLCKRLTSAGADCFCVTADDDP